LTNANLRGIEQAGCGAIYRPPEGRAIVRSDLCASIVLEPRTWSTLITAHRDAPDTGSLDPARRAPTMRAGVR
jgi:hypothetical protein